jgi:hypothetical protein
MLDDEDVRTADLFWGPDHVGKELTDAFLNEVVLSNMDEARKHRVVVRAAGMFAMYIVVVVERSMTLY